MAGDTFAATGKTHSLGRRRLDIDITAVNRQIGGNVFTHRQDVRHGNNPAQSGSLPFLFRFSAPGGQRFQNRVQIRDTVTMKANECCNELTRLR